MLTMAGFVGGAAKLIVLIENRFRQHQPLGSFLVYAG
jgi:hypothetical protein